MNFDALTLLFSKGNGLRRMRVADLSWVVITLAPFMVNLIKIKGILYEITIKNDMLQGKCD
jgi:hypothetical protein